MRKPRDYNTELKALEQKARQLKARRQSQLGELVIACGAEALTSEELAGALLAIAGTADRATREAWRQRGAAFFSGARASVDNGTGSKLAGAAQDPGSTPPPGSEPSPA